MAYFREIPIRLSAVCGAEPKQRRTQTEGRAAGADFETEAILYLTGDPFLARKMRAEGKAVLPVCLPENRGADFSGFAYLVEDPEEAGTEYFEKVYRRLKGLPWIIAVTERTIIRESMPEDAGEFIALYEKPEVSAFLSDIHDTVEEETAYLTDYARQVYGFYEYGMWTVLDRSTGKVIGRAGFAPGEESADPELGYVIDPDRQGQGIAYEVCSALLDYGFAECGFERVNCLIEKENLASRRLSSKLGFAEDGAVIRNNITYRRMVLNGPICRTEH